MLTDVTLGMNRLSRENALVRRQEELSELYVKVKLFEAVVWFPRLQAQVNGSDARGMSGECGSVVMLTWCCAGRCLITLRWSDQILSKRERKDPDTVTLITADDEKPWARDDSRVAPNMGPMGIQGIDAEYLDALTMLYEAVRYGGEITLASNADVTVAV